MNEKEILFQQYKLCSELKDKFTERNFNTNKFYLGLVIVMFLILFTTQNTVFEFGLNSTIILSLIGMGICLLWWSNVDTYGVIIGVKMKKVIEAMEEELPFKANQKEKEGLDELRKQRKAFVFGNMQKGLITGIFILYMVLFFIEFIPLLYRS